MSVQWMAVAGFLYLEMFIAALFIIPFISASWWNKIFKSGIVRKFGNYSTLYFNILLAVLAVLFLDAIREVIKYNSIESKIGVSHEHHSESVVLMRLFRAQRNLYVSGFALFMWFILRRKVTLISKIAHLEAVSEASMKQAKSASAAAKSLLDDNNVKKQNVDSELQVKLNKATIQLESYEKEIGQLELNLETLKKQSERNNHAYDELLTEHEVLQNKLANLENKMENKKDD